MASEGNIGRPEISDRGNPGVGGYDCARSQLNGKPLLRTMAHGLTVTSNGEWGSVQFCHERCSAFREGMPQVTVQCGDRVKIITASLHDVRNAFTQRGVDGVRLDGVNFYLSIREGYGGSIHGVGTGAGHDADKRSGHSAGLVQRCQVAECASLRRLDQSLACFR